MLKIRSLPRPFRARDLYILKYPESILPEYLDTKVSIDTFRILVVIYEFFQNTQYLKTPIANYRVVFSKNVFSKN